jgi:hypothetical protein
MNVVERNACTAFTNVIEKLFGNHKDEDYENIVRIMFKNFHILGCNMSLKVHFLFSHLNLFLKNLGAVSEEQGERFDQDIKQMERFYQGRWSVSMMVGFCGMYPKKKHTADNQLKEVPHKASKMLFP